MEGWGQGSNHSLFSSVDEVLISKFGRQLQRMFTHCYNKKKVSAVVTSAQMLDTGRYSQSGL